jgi:diguanylate cyclase (GGDEF)-like protein
MPRLLVLDDDPSLRELVKRVFETEGWDVQTAVDGRDGLQWLLQRDFDIALVDLRMEGMDGLAFLQEARKIWPWLGIVVYSGYLDARSVKRAKEAGVTRFIAKPTRVTQIKDDLLAEMQERKSAMGPGGNHMFSRMQYQLSVLRQLTEAAIRTQDLTGALRSLSNGLARIMSCGLIGVLGQEGHESILYLRNNDNLSQQTLENVQREMICRFEALSGQQLHRKKLRMEINGEPGIDTDNPEAASITSVPVISGKHVHGIITLASRKENAFDAEDISFIYHAANHLSSVLAALSQLHHLAIRDPLTGLYNRRHLEEELDRIHHISQRYDYPMSVLLIDMDRFKQVNDMLGHNAGDRVLADFAKILSNMTRASDVVARYGGDEFMILLPHATPQEAVGLADRLLHAMRVHPFEVDTHRFDLTLSIGIAATKPDARDDSTAQIIMRADDALYKAKSAGRNQYVIWSGASRQQETPDKPALPMTDTAPEPGARILVVDDKPAITRLIQQFLQQERYTLTCRHRVDDALELLEQYPHDFDIVMTDLTMPDEDGFTLLQKVKQIDEAIVCIIISGHATADNAISALRYGAYDFLPKPFLPEQLLSILRRSIEYRKLLLENRQYRQHLEEMVEAKSQEASQALEEIKSSYQFTLETMAAMLDARERETSMHSRRVSELTRLLAFYMGVKEPELDAMGRGALVHDIGKIGIPDAILNKPGPLTPAEWDIMKTHSEIGYRFLKNCTFLKTEAELLIAHHEAYDGSGYPRGLKGEEICLGARIFMVIDSYDTMRSARIYKKPMSAADALREIKAQRGRQFDPKVVDTFVRHHREIEQAGQWPDQTNEDA